MGNTLANIVWPLVAAPFIGSFLSVLVVRLPAERPVALARSACPSCGHTLSAADLVPLLSWAALRGRCRYCGDRVSLLYPGLELGALGVALWAVLVVPPALIWPTCGLGWVLLALAATDFRRFILPDSLTLPLIAAGLGVAWWIDESRIAAHLIGAGAGFLAFYAIAWAYRRVRGREGLGLGDAKLLAAAGAWVSWQGLASVVLWGTLLGLGYTLLKSAGGTRLTMTYRVPFGGFLCVGLWLVWLYGPFTIA